MWGLSLETVIECMMCLPMIPDYPLAYLYEIVFGLKLKLIAATLVELFN